MKCPSCNSDKYTGRFCNSCRMSLLLNENNEILYCRIIIVIENNEYVIRFFDDETEYELVYGQSKVISINESFLSQLNLNDLYFSCENILSRLLKLKEFT
jgi:hypothetical protein